MAKRCENEKREEAHPAARLQRRRRAARRDVDARGGGDARHRLGAVHQREQPLQREVPAAHRRRRRLGDEHRREVVLRRRRRRRRPRRQRQLDGVRRVDGERAAAARAEVAEQLRQQVVELVAPRREEARLALELGEARRRAAEHLAVPVRRALVAGGRLQHEAEREDQRVARVLLVVLDARRPAEHDVAEGAQRQQPPAQLRLRDQVVGDRVELLGLDVVERLLRRERPPDHVVEEAVEGAAELGGRAAGLCWTPPLPLDAGLDAALSAASRAASARFARRAILLPSIHARRARRAAPPPRGARRPRRQPGAPPPRRVDLGRHRAAVAGVDALVPDRRGRSQVRAGRRRPLYMSDDARDLVAIVGERYKEDIARFGYVFPANSSAPTLRA